MDFVMLRADTVYAPKALNQAYRVPVQVLVLDLVAVLEIEAFGKDICGDEDSYLRTGVCIFRIRLRREPGDNPTFVWIVTVDDLDIFPLVSRVQIPVKVLCCVLILRKYQDLSILERLLLEETQNALEFGILL